MAFLAEQASDQFIQARQVGVHLGVPTDSALKVLQALARHGLIQSQLGRSGGYRLSRPADLITIAQVVEAVRGPIQGRAHLSTSDNKLTREIDILQGLCDKAAITLRAEFDRLTVADLRRTAPVSACVNS